ncbi:transglutaminase-like cysteine peptidase [Phenylobacterium sp. J367]|uniref:transglutaminase-like cysteine peptidase n=1 Tax=Phenylobacterium sp. J367 TaxID=2898435 RepID=UPI0021510B94|nr:transglutaminase-like cysteine peptidase [Phenylobacterium sp. J367]MCR5879403.1 transglutaminase-like cysteine peptidase [Phenylobacterium sp. J367]
MLRQMIAAIAAMTVLTAAGAAGANSDVLKFGARESGLLQMVNESVNDSHAPGTRLSSDPDGMWDAGNYAAAKYRTLRDEFGWSPYRLAIGLVDLPDGQRHIVLLVKGFDGLDWGVLDYVTDEIVPLRARQKARWRVRFADFEPAASPAAAWVMTARTTPAPLLLR